MSESLDWESDLPHAQARLDMRHFTRSERLMHTHNSSAEAECSSLPASKGISDLL